ncbi:MAG: hypothetical protein JW778_03895 [Candidatus Altiarchaeota archaeon]|nr:hypothetical protein [Candidatus Altiarchaeota archaeon]
MKKTVVILALALFSSLYTAQTLLPGVPHQFYGSVDFINGPAPNGSLIEAKIEGVTVASTTALNGEYGYSPKMFFVTDPNNNRDGKTINFYVNGIDTGETYVFNNGETTKLDLTVPASVPTTTTTQITTTTTMASGGGGSSGGGGGGGGGGGIISKPKESCFDGIKNQGEEGVDCGGPCDPCISCSDGIQNQGETGIDCGGPCAPCSTTTTIMPTTTKASTPTSAPTTTSAEVTTTSLETTTTTIALPSVTGRILEGSGGTIVISIVILFLFLLGAYYWKTMGKK